MTRERLLKIAKEGDAAVQQEMYDKLCNKLEIHTKTAQKRLVSPQMFRLEEIALLLLTSAKLQAYGRPPSFKCKNA